MKSCTYKKIEEKHSDSKNIKTNAHVKSSDSLYAFAACKSGFIKQETTMCCVHNDTLADWRAAGVLAP